VLLVDQHAAVSVDFALATLRNANGLTARAAMLAAELARDQQKMTSLLEAQYSHLDCLPPLAPGAAPPVRAP
jgi:hypothetical protein